MSSQLKTYYHVTLLSNLESIQKEGLQVRLGENCKKLKTETPGVYLFPDLGEVETAFGSPWGEEAFDTTKDHVILRVEADPADMVSEVDWERCCLVNIPAERISVESYEPAVDEPEADEPTGMGVR